MGKSTEQPSCPFCCGLWQRDLLGFPSSHPQEGGGKMAAIHLLTLQSSLPCPHLLHPRPTSKRTSSHAGFSLSKKQFCGCFIISEWPEMLKLFQKSQSGSKNLWLTLKVWMEVDHDVSLMSKLLICRWNRCAAQTSLRLPRSCLPVVIFHNNVASNKLHFRCSISTFRLLSTSSPHVSIWYPGGEVADTDAHFVPLYRRRLGSVTHTNKVTSALPQLSTNVWLWLKDCPVSFFVSFVLFCFLVSFSNGSLFWD